MKLDRNIPPQHRGKYALIKLRVAQPKVRITTDPTEPIMAEVESRAIDFGNTPDTDFFVIRLKDRYAAPALAAYAMAAYADDAEYGLEVLNLAKLAAEHPYQKGPD